eukprot:g52326.t1
MISQRILSFLPDDKALETKQRFDKNRMESLPQSMINSIADWNSKRENLLINAGRLRDAYSLHQEFDGWEDYVNGDSTILTDLELRR